MATLGTVVQLWRYPVKSMQGEQVERLDLEDKGVVGDRRWGVVETATGKVLSAKRWAALLEASARLDDATGAVVVSLPDGQEYDAEDPSLSAVLSAWLDHEVDLARPDPDRGRPFEMGVDPTDDDSPVFEWAGPPGVFTDLAGVHLMTEASLAAGAAIHPEGIWDVRRFRPTALIATDDSTSGGEGFVEDAWVGTDILFGQAGVEVFMPTVRCAMPTRAQPGGLPRDLTISRTLARHHEGNLGVYGAVRAPGPVTLGDLVARPPAR